MPQPERPEGGCHKGMAMVTRYVAVLVLAWAAALGPCRAGEIVIHVDHVSPKGGILSAALFDRADYHDDNHPLAARNVAAVSPSTTVVFSGVKPGLYAVKMFQDINRNGKFDTGFLGLPLEPYGFSNNASPIFGEPGFDATKFRVGAGTTRISVRLSGTDAMAVPHGKASN